jgi:cobalt-zinc-cadmium resistance protein CzcA
MDSLGQPDAFDPLPPLQPGDSALPGDHPLLRYARQQVEVNAATVRVEKARGLPSFSLGAATQSLNRIAPYNMVLVGANIPLFNYGVKARVKAADIGRQIAETGVERTGLELTATWRQWWEQYARANSQLDYYRQEGLKYAALILTAATKGYRAGNIGYVEYVQNIKEATTIREGYLRTVNEYNQAVIQIDYFLNR